MRDFGVCLDSQGDVDDVLVIATRKLGHSPDRTVSNGMGSPTRSRANLPQSRCQRTN